MGYVVAIGGMLMQIFARNFVIFVIRGVSTFMALRILRSPRKSRRCVFIRTRPCGWFQSRFVLTALYPSDSPRLLLRCYAIAEVPTEIPVVSSVRTTITKIGSVVMTILMGFLIQHLGYEVTLFIIAGECVIAAVLWFFAKKIP
ncbi:MAG: hypothetical protein IJM53_05565 [Lachnospiraceae bacterium]|nr:hypothetical protein [Lachnospiraceae bacterium]